MGNVNNNTKPSVVRLVILLSSMSMVPTAEALQMAAMTRISTSNNLCGSQRTRLLNSQTENESSIVPVEDEIEKAKKNPNLLRLAELSLKDYDWRSSVFKSEEADRKVEESLARMMGDEPAYVRPMDATEEKRGPLVSDL